jgi:DNA repair exonuclease SbcCD ATPase subunit
MSKKFKIQNFSIEELKKVEDEYKATRQKVNDLRVQNHLLKEKTQEIQEESKEYSQFIDKKREKRQNRIISVNDDQQATLKRLEDDDKQAEREHQERMAKLDEEISLALFKRSGLKDQLMNLSDSTALKDRNDRRIKELEEEYARRQIEDSEMLQNLKGTRFWFCKTCKRKNMDIVWNSRILISRNNPKHVFEQLNMCSK